MEDISLSFFINHGVAGGVLWYVLTHLNKTLDKLSGSIDNLNEHMNDRLTALESNQRLFQMQLHELKMHVDAMRRGD